MLNILLGIGIIVAVFFLLKKIQSKSVSALETKQEGLNYLQAHQSEEGTTTTASGLQMQTLEEGAGNVHPKLTDKVLVHYHGMLINGQVFDSSVDRQKPITFALNQVIKGWTEGLQVMVEGQKSRLVIPSQLAYGSRSMSGIPAHSVLIFDVELIKINP